MNTATRVRLARKRADRLNLKLIKNGHHFRLRDADEITLAVGHLGVVEAFLAAAKSQNKPPGPPPSLHAPPSWRRDIDDYLLNLNAAGQRPATIRLRKTVLCAAAHGLGRPPADVTAEHLLDWLGKQQHLSPEGRKTYRSTLRGFFVWAYEMDRVRDYVADSLPKVRCPKQPPRPAGDDVWQAALAKADRRIELMIRLAGEAGLRRAEAAQAHTGDLMDGGLLLVHGKGGKRRIVPISDYLAALIRDTPHGYLFPNGTGGHLTAEHVGKLVSRALPGDATMHTLRHRYATRAYRGSTQLASCTTTSRSRLDRDNRTLHSAVRRRGARRSSSRMVSRPGVCCSRSASPPTGGSYFGQRRLEAARLLGWERIPVHVCHTIADVVDRAKAERSETRFARISPPRSCSPLVAGSPSWNGRKPNSGNAKAATMAARLDILA
ncbi:integrase [Mycobacterium tuberculosis GM 1503]|nr:integrase [Mycobacterium tuberculosis GM 1503]